MSWNLGPRSESQPVTHHVKVTGASRLSLAGSPAAGGTKDRLRRERVDEMGRGKQEREVEKEPQEHPASELGSFKVPLLSHPEPTSSHPASPLAYVRPSCSLLVTT